MNLLTRLLKQLATMPHTRAFLFGTIDEPKEREHAIGMLVELGIPAIVAAVLFTNVLMGPLQDAPVAGPVFDAALPDEGITILARAPGTDPKFALDFCNDPVTKAEPPGPVDVDRITLTRGTDTLSWTGNETAPAWYQNKDKGEPVEMTPASVACFRKKAAKR